MQQGSLIVHLIMLSIAIGIGYLYIMPTIDEIRQNQDTASTFSTELVKVSEVNAQLAAKLSVINSIPQSDRQKLVTFAPDSLDQISLMRTLEAIMLSVNIEPVELSYGESTSGASGQSGSEVPQSSTSAELLTSSTISVSFTANEADALGFLEAVTRSAVPFVMQTVSFTPTDNELVSVAVTFSVSALAENVVAETAENPNDLSEINL